MTHFKLKREKKILNDEIIINVILYPLKIFSRPNSNINANKLV